MPYMLLLKVPEHVHAMPYMLLLKVPEHVHDAIIQITS